MSLDLVLDSGKTIAVITSKDNSLKNVSSEAYQDYLEDLDEKKLIGMEGEPTKFILKVVLDYVESKEVFNSQVSMDKKGELKMNLSYMFDDVRFSLVGMEGVGAEKFVKDKDGFASVKLINALHNAGVLMDLFNARQNAGNTSTEQQKKS